MDGGEKVPAVQFEATNNLSAAFEQYRGKWLVVYFYPKDATPGCTIEGCDFKDAYELFSQHNTLIFGVSRDSLSSHERFKTKQDFPFELISDPEEMLCQLFEVIKIKFMYGKQVKGIERSTFIIDPNGVLRHIWRKVNVNGHVEEVLSVLKSLQQGGGC